MPFRRLYAYVAGIAALAAAAVVALLTAAGGGLGERPWLIGVFGGAIALEHLFETRLVRGGEQGESTSHEESFLVAMALLAPPAAVAVAFGAGFLGGNLLLRRSPLKAVFNVAAMVLAAGLGLLAVHAAGGSTSPTVRSAVAVLLGALVFVVVNRLAVAGVLALAGAGSFGGNLRDDPSGHILIPAGNVSIGLLAGLAAAVHLWTLAFGLAAMVVLHFALAGHGRARAGQQRLADIVASSSDGIATLDREGRIISWNPASERITGYRAADVVGVPLAQLSAMLEARREPYDVGIDELDASGEQRAVGVRAADGSERWLTVSRAALPEGGAVLVFRDETVRRQIDDLRAERERERLRSDLVATVSHELRTPLTSILGFTQTLLERTLGEDARRRYLEIMRAEAERLAQLIDDLLDLREATEGRLGVVRDRLDLADVLREQVEAHAGSSETHRLVLDLPENGLPVEGERRRLTQVVANLLSNAIKYSPAGGDVIVTARVADGWMRVAVSDAGLGIPAEVHQRIFTRFFRVDSPDRRAIGGTGLGLALTREIVEAHGGRIGFVSAEGEGSTFYFELPAA